jgi:hypothetical protein
LRPGKAVLPPRRQLAVPMHEGGSARLIHKIDVKALAGRECDARGSVRPGEAKKPPSNEKTPSKRPAEAIAVSLTPGKLSAVRAAFKAGVRPSKIAKQFGISQSDVRKVLRARE